MAEQIIAYVADWSFDQDLLPGQAQVLTQINYAFGHIENGGLSVRHLHQLPRLKKVRQDFPNLKVFLSVGGWGADGFSQAVATAEGRERLAASALAVARELDLDGLDWDWEYPGSTDAGIAASPDDPANMTAFLCLMRRKLDALGAEKGRRLGQSIAVGAGRTRDYLWPQALTALDTVNLMTYDMGMGDRVGHVTNLFPGKNASFSAHSGVQAFEKAGVPREKLLIGGTFYYHTYEGAALAPGETYEKKGDSLPHDRLDESACQRVWDEECRAVMFRAEDRLYSGDDVQSLREKGAYIRRQHLGGIILWELGHDKKNRLLPALRAD